MAGYQRRKRNSYRRAKPSVSAAAHGSYEFEHGFVLVHGIGPTREGGTLEGFAAPAANLLSSVYGTGRVSWEGHDKVAGNRAAVLEVRPMSTRAERILLVESRWTDLTDAPRLTGKAMWWALVALLTVGPHLIGPGSSEFEKAEAAFQDLEGAQLPRARHWASIGNVAANMVWRLSVLAALVAFCGWVAASLSSLGWIGLVIALLLVTGSLGAFVLLPTDLLGQVCVVASDRERRLQVLDSVRATAEAVQARCESVTLIGHSQGGYIAYEVLRTWHHSRLQRVERLIGVGSGVKPIRLLSTMRGARAIAGALLWGAAAVMLVIMGALVAGRQGPTLSLSVDNERRGLDYLLFPILLLEDAPEPTDVELLDRLGNSLWQSYIADLPLMVLLIAAVALAIFGEWLRGRYSRSNQWIAATDGVKWEEWATPSDIVGRLAIPRLPSTVTMRYAAGSHTVLDHLLSSYFRGSATPPAQLASTFLNETQWDNSEKARWSQVLEERGRAALEHAARWRRARGAVQLWLLVAMILAPFVLASVPLLDSFAHAWGVLLVSGAITAFVAWLAIRRRARRDAIGISAQVADPSLEFAWWPRPEVGGVYWLRVLALLTVSIGGWCVVAGLAALTSASLAYGVAAAVMAPLVLVLLAYFAAVVADFRVPPFVALVMAFFTIVAAVVVFAATAFAGTSPIGVPGLEVLFLLAGVQVAEFVLALLRSQQWKDAWNERLRSQDCRRNRRRR